jgi:ABC-2 type transport system permease protein
VSAYASAEAPPRVTGTRGGLLAAYAAEQRKLLAQTSTRVTLLACTLGPLAVALVLTRQSGVPGDSLLGTWIHSSGSAVGFVMLDFAGYLGFPILAGLVAGDLFSSEDRYGTWKALLTRSCSRKDVFAAKVLAGSALASACAVVMAVSSIAGGLLFAGSQPLVGLGGAVIPSGEAALLLLCGWLLNIPPLIGFVALATLLSVASRSGTVAVAGTAIAGFLMQLLSFVGNGSWTGWALLGSAFDDWHGLLASPRFFAPLAVALGVSLLWIAGALSAAWLLLRRRDFAGPPGSRLRGWLPSARMALGAAVVCLALIAAIGAGPTTITRGRLAASVSRNFERLTVLQQRQLGRPVPAHPDFKMKTNCARRGRATGGPGDDWICTITLLSAQTGFNPLELSAVAYEVSVKANGCYKADGPPTFIGEQTLPGTHRGRLVNPLFTIYGCFDPTGQPSHF